MDLYLVYLKLRMHMRRLSQLPATVHLIVLNVIIFVIECITSMSVIYIRVNWFVRLFALSNYYVLVKGWIWQLLTSMFLHFGILHLFFNMFFLFILGIRLEKLIGRRRFLLLYIVAGVVGNLFTLLWGPYAPIISAGASGAIFGVFGALVILSVGYSYATTVQALMWAFLIFLINSIMPGVNILAHLGGLLTGLLYGYHARKRFIRPVVIAYHYYY
ncbi:rhomboid family intramembrane serine protease [archaeon]|nr:MAG: rhomboid family intramembrane serine protease [archaeon]RLG65397.1 MAG: rhomboid family intramembrane serine protease [archaeon]